MTIYDRIFKLLDCIYAFEINEGNVSVKYKFKPEMCSETSYTKDGKSSEGTKFSYAKSTILHFVKHYNYTILEEIRHKEFSDQLFEFRKFILYHLETPIFNTLITKFDFDDDIYQIDFPRLNINELDIYAGELKKYKLVDIDLVKQGFYVSNGFTDLCQKEDFFNIFDTFENQNLKLINQRNKIKIQIREYIKKYNELLNELE